jgi:hypothetical protein
MLMLLLASGLAGCKKDEEPDWESCYSCTVSSWTGSFKGTGDVYDASAGTTQGGIGITLSFGETGDQYLTAHVVVSGYLNLTLSGTLYVHHSISFASSQSSLNATLYEKDGQLKLSGTVKSFTESGNGDPELDLSVSFEAIKE